LAPDKSRHTSFCMVSRVSRLYRGAHSFFFHASIVYEPAFRQNPSRVGEPGDCLPFRPPLGRRGPVLLSFPIWLLIGDPCLLSRPSFFLRFSRSAAGCISIRKLAVSVFDFNYGLCLRIFLPFFRKGIESGLRPFPLGDRNSLGLRKTNFRFPKILWCICVPLLRSTHRWSSSVFSFVLQGLLLLGPAPFFRPAELCFPLVRVL